MNVVLLNPIFNHNSSGCKLIPLGLGYIHAAIRNNHNVKVLPLDLEHYGQFLIDVICSEKIDIVGITVYEGIFEQIVMIGKYIKRISPFVKIVLGGPFPTFAFEYILKNYKQFDFIILGEGEKPFKELLSVLEDTSKSLNDVSGLAFLENETVVSSNINDFDPDEFPIPSWDALYPFPEDKHNNLIPITAAIKYS